MGKYGETALKATNLYREGKANNPKTAWDIAVEEVFRDEKTSQKKSCPRGAYLGLCEEGMVVGVPNGNYCRAKKNKSYAIKALSVIKLDIKTPLDEKKLWELVMDGEIKTYNNQMDVVLTLWNEGCICEYP